MGAGTIRVTDLGSIPRLLPWDGARIISDPPLATTRLRARTTGGE
jgi:hypothetical protein